MMRKSLGVRALEQWEAIAAGSSLKPTRANALRLMGGQCIPWGGFKHILVSAGIVAKFTDDCPVPWIEAYKKAAGR